MGYEAQLERLAVEFEHFLQRKVFSPCMNEGTWVVDTHKETISRRYKADMQAHRKRRLRTGCAHR